MKPFDLEAFKAGKIALTRDGRKAEFVGYCEKVKYSVVGLIEGKNVLDSFAENGLYLGHVNSSADLICMAPEEQTLWVNVYRDKNDAEAIYTGKALYESEVEARHLEASPQYIGAFPITIKE